MQDLTKGSLARNLIQVAIVLPALAFSRMSGFALHWIWYLAVGCVVLQMTLNVLFLQREYRRKLAFPPAALRVPG